MLGLFRPTRFLFLLAVLAGAVGVPYFMARGNAQGGNSQPGENSLVTSVTRWWQGSGVGGTAEPSDMIALERPLIPTVAETTDLGAARAAAMGETAPIQDLSEVLSFDMTVDQIIQRWPHVSTGLGGPSLQGYRVPLVSGIQEDDVAGALTYYFGSDRRVHRITFSGTTGDADKLIGVLMKKHGLVRHATADAGVYLYRSNWNGSPVAELSIRPRPVLRADVPHRRFDITLRLDRFQPRFRQSAVTQRTYVGE